MTQEPLVIERTINAPAEKVWQAISDKDLMKEWYFDMPDFKAEVDAEFSFEGSNEDRTFVHLCLVTEVIEQQKLAHSWRYKGYEGNSFVTWELFEEGDKTRVKLTHKGLETFPPTEHNDFAKENFLAGWTEIVENLLPAYLQKRQAEVAG